MKKFGLVLLTIALCFGLVACGNDKDTNTNGNIAEMSLNEIMDVVYEGVSEENLPMMIERKDLKEADADTKTWFLGSDAIEFEEALGSESGIGSYAHSIVLVKVAEGADVEATMASLKDSIDPRKWICVGVEPDQVVIENIGNVILVAIDETDVNPFVENFEPLR